MKILLINNTFGNFGGGAEKATLETGKILTENGHDVYYFASDRKPYYEKNYEYQRFFPKNSKKIFFNLEAKKNLDYLLKEINPDIIHINCFQHNLTSSVLVSCEESKIPTVMTLHDTNFACPTGTLTKKGHFCVTKDCIKGSSYSCIKNRCFNNSLLKSIVAGTEFSYRRSFGFYRVPAYFICPSKFILELAAESGIPREKLVLVSNFINNPSREKIKPSSQGYFLFAGRIVREKGLDSLVEAFRDLPGIKLKIAGHGAYEKELKKYISLNNIKNIEFIGLKKGAELDIEYQNCFATILPSICSEAFGLSILESFEFGKPVIASNIGGIPEVIDNYKDGILIEPGNSEQLKKSVLLLWNTPELAEELGKNANLKFRNLYSPEIYYKKIINIYEKALNKELEFSDLVPIRN